MRNLFTFHVEHSAQKTENRKIRTAVTISSICITNWNSVHTRCRLSCRLNDIVYMRYRFAFSHTSRTITCLARTFDGHEIRFLLLNSKFDRMNFALFAFDGLHMIACGWITGWLVGKTNRFDIPHGRSIHTADEYEIQKLKFSQRSHCPSCSQRILSVWLVCARWSENSSHSLSTSTIGGSRFSTRHNFLFKFIYFPPETYTYTNYSFPYFIYLFSFHFFSSPYLQIASKRYWAVTQKYW